MKRIKHILLLFFCVTLIFIPVLSTQASETNSEQTATYHASATITAQNGLNVRSGPGKSYDVLGQLASGAEITITGQLDNGWYPIDYNGQTGYVSSKYVSEPVEVIDNTEVDLNTKEDLFHSLSNLSIVDSSTIPLLIAGIVIILLLMFFTLVQVFKLTSDINHYQINNNRSYQSSQHRTVSYEEDADEYDDDDYDDDDDDDDDYNE